MYRLVVFVLFTAFVTSGNGQSIGRNCQESRKPCVPWSMCSTVTDLMQRYDPHHVLMAFLCGVRGNNFFVCCPTTINNQNESEEGDDENVPVDPENEDSEENGNDEFGAVDDDDDIPPPKRWNDSPNENEENEISNEDDFDDNKLKARKRQSKKKPKKGKRPKKTINKRDLLPTNDCGIQATDKILGGQETQLEEFPWMALLHLGDGSGRGQFICGGSIISSRYVLTAAHCVSDNDFPQGFRIDKVRLGEHDQNEDQDCQGRRCSLEPQDIPIEKIISHAQYGGQNGMNNDIALLRLRSPVKFNTFVQPICLPFDKLENVNYDGQYMWNSGWGKTTNRRDSASPFKLKVKLKVMPLSECKGVIQRVTGATPTPNQICAGGVKSKSSCHGDSGGPLMKEDMDGSVIRWHVHGVVSYGSSKCGMSGVPAVYTRVGKYIKWILQNIEE